jgi:hypothetical protein
MMSAARPLLFCLLLLGCAAPDDLRVVSQSGDKIVLSWFPGAQKEESAYARASEYCQQSDRSAFAGVEREGSRMRTREFVCNTPPVRTAEGLTYE